LFGEEKNGAEQGANFDDETAGVEKTRFEPLLIYKGKLK